jgi:hypothetical protein
MIEESAK